MPRALAPRAVEIVAGLSYNCARMDDGTVRCWGANYSGQCGVDPGLRALRTPLPVPGLSHVTSLVARYGHTCAVRDDGSVWCWGPRPKVPVDPRAPVPATGPVRDERFTDVSRIGFDGAFACALRRDGSVWCAGANTHGEVGDGSLIPRAAPVRVAALPGPQTAIAVGDEHACALGTDGRVRCWGAGADGQLGDGLRRDRATPVEVRGLTAVQDLFAGWRSTCARDAAGRAMCWGANRYGQLGDGTRSPRHGPVRVRAPAEYLHSMWTDESGACAARDDGAVVCWGRDTGAPGLWDACRASHRPPPRVRGPRPAPASGASADCPTPFAVPGLADVAQVAFDLSHTCALGRDGAVLCWGGNYFGAVSGDGFGVVAIPRSVAF